MMDNFDSNMIRPVEGLQNITGLTQMGRREQRKKKQNFNSDKNEQQRKHEDEEDVIRQFDESVIIDDADDTKIDFCA